jgi:hypothetical protein
MKQSWMGGREDKLVDVDPLFQTAPVATILAGALHHLAQDFCNFRFNELVEGRDYTAFVQSTERSVRHGNIAGFQKRNRTQHGPISADGRARRLTARVSVG